MDKTAIFAGRGVLPEEISRQLPDALVVSFKGVGLDFVPAHHYEAQFEKAGALFKRLRQEGVTQICFAGALSRPNLSLWRMDFKTLRIYPKIRTAIANSDGNALKIIRAIVEVEGFKVVGAHEICPELLAGVGQLGEINSPEIDLERAQTIHEAMGRLDIGQALVMQDELCLAVETLAGTKAMLAFVAEQNTKGGYLFKASKPDQDLAMDMASVGLDTVAQVKAAGLDGMVLGAGRTLMLQKEKMLKAADAEGIFVIGI